MRQVAIEPTFKAWRTQARALINARVPPAEILWFAKDQQQAVLPGVANTALPLPITNEPTPRVPAAFVSLAHDVACFRDDGRFDLLYRLLFRITGGDYDLLDNAVDDDVHRARMMSKAVRHDEHRMHAFVRFRQVIGQGGYEHLIAYHQPDHLVVHRVADFFADRLGAVSWSLLTPDECAHSHNHNITFSPGVPRSRVPVNDELDDLWRTYYAAIFNPARVNPHAMQRHMPRKHWGSLPEASLFSPLVQTAKTRVDVMAAQVPLSASAFLPASHTLPELAEAAKACRGCPLYAPATQTVFGEGPSHARLVLVGEQPGDEEDRQGHPFIGPGGKVLDEALQAAQIPRASVYITNAVKHFKFEPRGKTRIHSKPRSSEVSACKPWLHAEIAAIKPVVIVALGATAASALFGPTVRLGRDRGQTLATPLARHGLATYHPSAVLRARDEQQSQALMKALCADLATAYALLQKL